MTRKSSFFSGIKLINLLPPLWVAVSAVFLFVFVSIASLHDTVTIDLSAVVSISKVSAPENAFLALIYLNKRSDNSPVKGASFFVAAYPQLSEPGGSNQPVAYSQATEMDPGIYLARLKLPPEAHEAGLDLVLEFQDGRSLTAISLPKRDLTLAVIPSEGSFTPGQTASFRVGIVDTAVMDGEPVVPVRCQVFSPDGEMIANRVVKTLKGGQTLFSHRLHPRVPEGEYLFRFHSVGKTISFSLPVIRGVTEKTLPKFGLGLFTGFHPHLMEVVSSHLSRINPPVLSSSRLSDSGFGIKNVERTDLSVILSTQAPTGSIQRIEAWTDRGFLRTIPVEHSESKTHFWLDNHSGSPPFLRFRFWFRDQFVARFHETIIINPALTSEAGRIFHDLSISSHGHGTNAADYLTQRHPSSFAFIDRFSSQELYRSALVYLTAIYAVVLPVFIVLILIGGVLKNSILRTLLWKDSLLISSMTSYLFLLGILYIPEIYLSQTVFALLSALAIIVLHGLCFPVRPEGTKPALIEQLTRTSLMFSAVLTLGIVFRDIFFSPSSPSVSTFAFVVSLAACLVKFRLLFPLKKFSSLAIGLTGTFLLVPGVLFFSGHEQSERDSRIIKPDTIKADGHIHFRQKNDPILLPIDYPDSPLAAHTSESLYSRFYIVEDCQDITLRMARRVRIFLDPASFWRRMARVAQSREFNLQTSLEEFCARVEFVKLARPGRRLSEIQRLESLVSVLASMLRGRGSDPEELPAMSLRLLRHILEPSNRVLHLSETLENFVPTSLPADESLLLGSFLGFQGSESTDISSKKFNSCFTSGGQLLIHGNMGSFLVPLEGRTVELIRGKSFREGFELERMTVLRASPILIELEL